VAFLFSWSVSCRVVAICSSSALQATAPDDAAAMTRVTPPCDARHFYAEAVSDLSEAKARAKRHA
jgi:hypothetical protein